MARNTPKPEGTLRSALKDLPFGVGPAVVLAHFRRAGFCVGATLRPLKDRVNWAGLQAATGLQRQRHGDPVERQGRPRPAL